MFSWINTQLVLLGVSWCTLSLPPLPAPLQLGNAEDIPQWALDQVDEGANLREDDRGW